MAMWVSRFKAHATSSGNTSSPMPRSTRASRVNPKPNQPPPAQAGGGRWQQATHLQRLARFVRDAVGTMARNEVTCGRIALRQLADPHRDVQEAIRQSISLGRACEARAPPPLPPSRPQPRTQL